MSLKTKKNLINTMLKASSELTDIVIDLHVASEEAKQEGNTEKATQIKKGIIKVKAKRAELAASIDEVIVSMIEDWLSEAESITASIEDATTELKAIEKDIEQRKETASNVIKVIGVVDDIVELIAKFA